jgi:hypothetical protein
VAGSKSASVDFDQGCSPQPRHGPDAVARVQSRTDSPVLRLPAHPDLPDHLEDQVETRTLMCRGPVGLAEPAAHPNSPVALHCREAGSSAVLRRIPVGHEADPVVRPELPAKLGTLTTESARCSILSSILMRGVPSTPDRKAGLDAAHHQSVHRDHAALVSHGRRPIANRNDIRQSPHCFENGLRTDANLVHRIQTDHRLPVHPCHHGRGPRTIDRRWAGRSKSDSQIPSRRWGATCQTHCDQNRVVRPPVAPLVDRRRAGNQKFVHLHLGHRLRPDGRSPRHEHYWLIPDGSPAPNGRPIRHEVCFHDPMGLGRVPP